MSKHTPGPWTVQSRSMDAPNADTIVINPDGIVVVHIPTYRLDEQQKADARLIAASPDLLAALKRIDSITGSTGGYEAMVNEFKHVARAAIEKAEGR